MPGEKAEKALRVLVLSASMGAGHDGAAKALAGRIEGRGHDAEVLDFLEAGPLRIGSAMRSGYEFELKHLPSAYDLSTVSGISRHGCALRSPGWSPA